LDNGVFDIIDARRSHEVNIVLILRLWLRDLLIMLYFLTLHFKTF